MTVRVRLETVLPMALAEAFDLSRDIGLHVDSMRASGEIVVAGRSSGLIDEGEHVAWRGRHFGVSFTLMSRITEFDRPRRFVDESIAGPFRRLRHEHRFTPHAEGTLAVDDIEFQAPFGIIGRLVERAVLERYMRELIAARNAHLVAVASRLTVR